MKFAILRVLMGSAIAFSGGAMAIVPPAIASQTLTSPDFAEGYQIGYRIGFQRGQEVQAAAADYSSAILGVGGVETQEADRRAATGYQAGFLAGFHEGFYHNRADAHPREIARFNDGHSRGYETGLQAAGTCRQQSNCAYWPQPTCDRHDTPQYCNGYRLGYWQAFERVWSGETF